MAQHNIARYPLLHHELFRGGRVGSWILDDIAACTFEVTLGFVT